MSRSAMSPILRCLVAALALAGSGREAGAAVSEGSLLTNMATGTFASIQTVEYEVSYGASANVIVVRPSVQMAKEAIPAVECSGGTVTFCIWAVNNSDYTSAFNVIIDDEIPDILAYVRGQSLWVSDSAGTTILQGYKAPGFGVYCWPGVIHASCPDASPSTGEPAEGQIGPQYRVRWAVNLLGPRQSVYICFKARVL